MHGEVCCVFISNGVPVLGWPQQTRDNMRGSHCQSMLPFLRQFGACDVAHSAETGQLGGARACISTILSAVRLTIIFF